MPQHTGRDIAQKSYFSKYLQYKVYIYNLWQVKCFVIIFQNTAKKIDGQQAIPAPDADSMNGKNLRVRQRVQQWYYSPTAYK